MSEYKYILNKRTGQFNLVPSATVATFKAAVPTYADLPMTGNIVGDARLTNDTGHLYIWDGATWQDQGDIMDLTWDAISGKPNSTPTEIDATVDGTVNGVILGTADPFGRRQIWNKLTDAVIRLGSLGEDGDPDTLSSEGIVVYGKNLQDDPMAGSNWSYARIKPNRIGIYNSKSGGYVGYIVRMDTAEDEWYITDNAGVRKFKFYRSTGELVLSSLSDGTNTVVISDLVNAVAASHTQNTDNVLQQGVSEVDTEYTLYFHAAFYNTIPSAGMPPMLPSSVGVAQTFKAPITGVLKQAVFCIEDSNHTGTLTIEVRDVVSGGLPGTTILGSQIIPPANIMTGPWIYEPYYRETLVPFSTPIAVTQNTEYALVIHPSDGAWCNVFGSNETPYYTDGAAFNEDSANVWSNFGHNPGSDMYCKITIGVGGITNLIENGELINDLAVQNGITVDGRDISVDGTKLDTLQSPLTGNVTYYVSTTGNDITGDGSSGTPFATIAHALNLIPKNLNGFTASVLINTGTYIEQGIRCESFKNGHLIIGKVSGTVTITSVSGSGDFIFYIWYNSAQVSINNLNLQVLDNNLFCLDIENCISVDATQMKFGDNGNTGTKGLYAFRSVVTAGCSDIDANKVSIGLYADDGSNILLYGLNTWGDTFLEPDAAGTIKDTNNLMLTGELSIKVYAQASEPTLTADNRIAIWIDTDDANKVYLLFRRGSGDVVSVELTGP